MSLSRLLLGGLAVVALALVAAGVLIGDLLKLQACPLCIFQRLLYLLIALLGLMGCLIPAGRRVFGGLLALTSLGGLATAGYQSWLQFFPESSLACGSGDRGWVELVVDWFGIRWPDLFMATGFCASKEWVFLDLSMANWSAVCFLGLGVAAACLAMKREMR